MSDHDAVPAGMLALTASTPVEDLRTALRFIEHMERDGFQDNSFLARAKARVTAALDKVAPQFPGPVIAWAVEVPFRIEGNDKPAEFHHAAAIATGLWVVEWDWTMEPDEDFDDMNAAYGVDRWSRPTLDDLIMFDMLPESPSGAR